jgi:alpha-glucuronidase
MNPPNEDGYELWLRYRSVDNAERLAQYRNTINSVVVLGTSTTAEIIKRELARALPALLDRTVTISEKPVGNALVVGTLDELKAAGVAIPSAESRELGAEGFLIRSQPSVIASAEGAKQSPSNLGIASSQTTPLATLAPHASAASYSEFVKGLPAQE